MHIKNSNVQLAPTDLSNYLSCSHLSGLDLQVAQGHVERPVRYSPVIEELRAKGMAHEVAYLAHLKQQGLTVVEIVDGSGLGATRDAMAAGADVIYQAPLNDTVWSGYADFLVRVESPSDFGDWSYEVQDTKLAKETRAGTVLQLCVYSYLVGQIQGIPPEVMHVVAPGRNWKPERHRCNDYSAYFRLLERGIHAFVTAPPETYPELVSHCDLCGWWTVCDKRRRGDDHLCYVAGMGSGQIAVLRDLGINSLEALASTENIQKPDRGALDTLLRLRDQARIQLKGRETHQPEHEIRTPFDPEHGFCHLPEPTLDDVFLDFEGSHFADGGVQEYLTGYVVLNNGKFDYTHLWADTLAQEKTAFEQFVDFALGVRKRNPAAHIYHFGTYESGALKRQVGRFATREVELDELLRGEVFVDLRAVVKRALIASVEGYSIKNLECHFGYTRTQDLREASESRRVIEAALELGLLDESTADHQSRVEVYNREDCESTYRLQQWLEQLRAVEIANGAEIPRPELKEGDASDDIKDLDRRLQDLRDRLLKDLPDEPTERTEEHQALFLLAHMMEFHRRENKAAWWENFRLRDLAWEDYPSERRTIAQLQFVEVLEAKAAPLHRYRFPTQEVDARPGDDVRDDNGNRIGGVHALHLGNGLIDVKKSKATADEHPTHVYFHKAIGSDPIRESLVRLGEHVYAYGLSPTEPYTSALRLLMRYKPAQSLPGEALRQADEDTVQAACRLVGGLDGDILAIQGPPGTGKTFTGAELICELVAAGKTVGVTAVSHKVIMNLLEKAAEAASKRNTTLGIVHKPKSTDGAYEGDSAILYEKKDAKILAGLADGSIRVQGGTAWLWSKPDFAQQVDVLIVDEAGQMALSNVLAVAPSAKSLVLLGDPQQLEQPLQSSHPEGSDIAALKHWLGPRTTMPIDKGLFLDVTWRLHPSICGFTSEVYYENRMTSKAGLEFQEIGGETEFSGSGLRYVPVEHTGNTARSVEEADVIFDIVSKLTDGSATWINQNQKSQVLMSDHILIVAPYNAQVALLQERNPQLASSIGTVDKFQGQEAPVVIYSMTSSSPEDAPRGMEFLYSPNRFNVATSRPRAICILVGNPTLLEPQCKSPSQMRMANGFCRYRELST